MRKIFLFLFEEYVLVKDFCTYSVIVSREVREQEVKTWKMTDFTELFYTGLLKHLYHLIDTTVR